MPPEEGVVVVTSLVGVEEDKNREERDLLPPFPRFPFFLGVNMDLSLLAHFELLVGGGGNEDLLWPDGGEAGAAAVAFVDMADDIIFLRSTVSIAVGSWWCLLPW